MNVPTPAPLLEARELTKSYKVRDPGHRRSLELRAVDVVDLSVAPSETLGIVGESGSGKSTLARLLLRLELATSGRISFDGRDITHLRGRDLRRLRGDVQAVFQDVAGSLDSKMTVDQLLTEPIRLHQDRSRRQARQRSAELLDLVGLSRSFGERYPYELSGGQRQRVSIARSLATEPRLLILDEPVSALDVSSQGKIVNLLERLQLELGLAYVFIAHDLYVVHHVSHRIAVMYLGAIVETGPTDRVLTEPSHPYTQALLDAIPDALRRGRTRTHIEGEVPSPLSIPAGCRFHTRCPHVMDRCTTESPRAHTVEGGGFAACHLLDPETTVAAPRRATPVPNARRKLNPR